MCFPLQVTGLRGIRYEPCLLKAGAVGAAAAANGIIFNPELFATRPTGAGTLPGCSLQCDALYCPRSEDCKRRRKDYVPQGRRPQPEI